MIVQVPLHLDSRSSQHFHFTSVGWTQTARLSSAELNFMECTRLRSTLCFGRVCYSRGLFNVTAGGVGARLVSSEPIVVDWAHVSCPRTSPWHRCLHFILLLLLFPLCSHAIIICRPLYLPLNTYFCLLVAHCWLFCLPISSPTPFFLSSVLFTSNLRLLLIKGTFLLFFWLLLYRWLLVGLWRKWSDELVEVV